MSKSKSLLIIMLSVVVVSFSHAANILYVDVNSPNDPGSGTFEDPFRKIQDAIDDGNDGDIIEIRPGLYTGQKNYDLDPNGKSLTIRSVDPNDLNVVASTIIDPNEAGRAFYFYEVKDANCIVSGLTIRNGKTGAKGGGIFSYNSNLIIRNCIISGNHAGTHGGAFFCQNSNVQIIGSIINGNSSANDGGGIEHWRGKSVVRNCVIIDNHANGFGGGLDYYGTDNDVTLLNCTIAGNRAGYGGGLYCWESNISVKNGILWANEADTGPQMALNSALDSIVSINYSDVQGGDSAVYDPSGGLIWGSNNIDTDPCFADPNNCNFHLKSQAGRCGETTQTWIQDNVTSACIDAGDPNSDWTEEPWPNGKHINMGAYGGTDQASKNGNIADFDVSGTVDLTDLMELACKWLEEEGGIVNLDLAGWVDFADFAIFADNWLWQQE